MDFLKIKLVNKTQKKMNECDIATVVVVHVGLYTDLKVEPRYITKQGILGVKNGKLYESNTMLLGR